MNIAYISHHGRHCYEEEWLSQIPCKKFKFIDTDFSKYKKTNTQHIEYCTVEYQENSFFNRFLHSTASIVIYKNFEQYLTDIDIVIVLEVFSSLSFQFTKYCKKNNIKIINIVYELIASHPIYKLPFFSRNTKYILQNTDMYICVSQESKNHLIEIGAPEKNIEIVSPGINIEKFPVSITKKKTININFLGKLERHKGIDIFLNITEKLIKKYAEKITITIIGTGKFSKNVKYLEKKYPQILTYIPCIKNTDISSVFHEDGIYVLPARDTYKWGMKIGSEQFCFSIVEAMACKNVIITTRCGAIPSIATSNNFFSNQNDEKGLYKNIEKLLKNDSLRAEISTKNREIVEKKYNIQQQAKKINTLFLKLS